MESITSHGCWVCVCVPIIKRIGETGRKTTYWAGEMCQKKDISGPFQLFFWFAVVMVLTVVLGVKLLWSVGQEEIGGVLGSGVSIVKR